MPHHGVVKNIGGMTLKSLEWANHLRPSEIQLLLELTLLQAGEGMACEALVQSLGLN